MRDPALKAPMPGPAAPLGVSRPAAVAALVLVAGLAGVHPGGGANRPRTGPPPGLATAAVRRADPQAGVTAAGWLESAENTLIRCELERLTAGGGAGGSSTIIDLIPEGTMARRGDVLCRLDASRYEELVVQQEIEVERARADRAAAAGDLEVAEIALREYREGLAPRTLCQLEGRIAAATADLNHQDERLARSRRMLELGYVAAGRVGVEEQARLRADLGLKRLRGELALFRRYSGPQTLRSLEIRAEATRSELASRDLRVRLGEERLAHCRLQVDRCTIRAPHDGLVIYANRPGRDAEIEPGAPVRRRQKLLLLPDLSRMEARVLLHETVVDRVRAGMPARIRPESSPAQCLTGRIIAVSPLPAEARRTADQVRYYEGRIDLDETPAGLRPGISCEVHITTAEHQDAHGLAGADDDAGDEVHGQPTPEALTEHGKGREVIPDQSGVD